MMPHAQFCILAGQSALVYWKKREPKSYELVRYCTSQPLAVQLFWHGAVLHFMHRCCTACVFSASARAVRAS